MFEYASLSSIWLANVSLFRLKITREWIRFKKTYRVNDNGFKNNIKMMQKKLYTLVIL